MAKSGIEIKGLKRAIGRTKVFTQQGVAAIRAAVYAEGLHIIREAVKNAPAVTGRLRNSHFVSWPDMSGTVTIGFGVKYAASVEYGTRVIEMTRERQKAAFANMRESGWKKSAVGGPGYFRNAINSTSSSRERRIAKSAKRLFEAGVGFVPFPGEPKTAAEGRAKSKKGK